MQRDADGDLFFGFCGARVYVPDDDPSEEGIAEGVLRRFRERLAAELAKDKTLADSKTANVRAKLPDAAQLAWTERDNDARRSGST